MKKLIILLSVILVIGAASGFCLANYGDMQVKLSQSLADEEDTPITEEDADKQSEETDEDAENKQSSLTVNFSKNKTFYEKDIEVELSCDDKRAVIYYTTNGNDPTEKSKRYTAPIIVKAKSKAAATTIKAIAVRDGEKSEIALKSYVTCTDIEKRFDENTYIFVLSTDEYNLYDYYYGVATEGYKRDEYLNSDEYRGGELPYNAPANWYIGGRESERDMFVEVYNNKGEQLICQPAGARVVGGYSRANEQKSWRLIARNTYSEGNGKFRYPFFGSATDAYGTIISKYDRITLRNGANDREFAGVRDELSMTLAEEAGFPDVQNVVPAAVFLNSEYYGYSWLHEAYCNEYLAMTYGGNEDNFRIVGAKEQNVEGDDQQSVDDWNHLLDLAEKGLVNESRFKEFTSLVDIDNLMQYYAIQIYIDNKDWPGNNFKAWRYYPSADEEITSVYLDGKWRFLLFDAEYAWGLYGAGYKANTLSDILTGRHMQGDSKFLIALLERKDMRQKFANTICDLIGGAFAPENVNANLDHLLEISDNEQLYALENGYTSTWARTNNFNESRQQIRDFAEGRPQVIMYQIAKQFDYNTETYTVKLYNSAGAKASLGSQKISGSGSLTASYFRNCFVDVTAESYNGYEIDRFEINGREVLGSRITLDSSFADSEGNINVRVYVKKSDESPFIAVSELYTSGDGDWIEIYNSGSEAVKLTGYYLSDNPEKLDKWEIPTETIPANGVLTIACKDNNEASALKRHRTNFKLKTGETLYFSDSDGNIISQVSVIEMDSDHSLTLGIDGIYRIDVVTEGTHIEE